jgi:hypothetical protein
MDSQRRAITVGDSRTFTVTVGGDKLWWMDCDITLTAREDITIKSAKPPSLPSVIRRLRLSTAAC